MGVTVYYRGRIDDLERVEDFEDRVLDMALEIGAAAQIWRSVSDHDPGRVVRGVILDLAPGQETTSLLVSPEGWLLPLMQIEDAEAGRLTEPPSCWVKTQYGPVEGHVALIELLEALKHEFISNLEVTDEGGYWENRDARALARNFGFLQAAVDGLAEALRHDGLSPEAAEDPQILVTRIERISRQVRQTLARPAEHPPLDFEEAGFDAEVDADHEAWWDNAFKEHRRKQERLHRALEERIGRGEDYGEAFENAMRDEGLIDLPEAAALGDVESDSDQAAFDDDALEEEFPWDEDEPWRESLPEELAEDPEEPFGRPDHHPLQERSLELMQRLHELSKGLDRNNSQLTILHRGAGEMMGGLAQALGEEPAESVDGWGRVQLRRALRGAAFARGALFALRAEGVIDNDTFDELHATVEQLQADILAEVSRARGDDLEPG